MNHDRTMSLTRVDSTVPNRLGVPDSDFLAVLLQESAARHQHLCPRQVLGVRLGLRGLRELGFIGNDYQPRFSNEDKRLLTITETDGCGSDGVGVATDCNVGRRTLRVLDHGKVAATLVDTHSGRSIRVAPTTASRALAIRYAPTVATTWDAYLEAYKIIPDEELILVQKVRLTQSVPEILSKPEARAICDHCGEEIMNDREVRRSALTLCRSCAGDSYYALLE